MARLARQVRDSAAQTIAGDRLSDSGADAEQLADLFAQTLVYGLFADRCRHPTRRSQRTATKVAIPTSDPFLCRLFETIMGREFRRRRYASFLSSLGQLFEDTDLNAVLSEHGADPVDHFYETFLAAYDPQLRKARGVYFTPAPVVSFIVRAVDHLLTTYFGVLGGLAEQQMPPRVVILDPACGTGNFLSGVIGHVRNLYVSRTRNCNVPHLHGFETLSVPHAIARLQLSQRLTGKEQLTLHLTSTFDEAVEQAKHMVEGLIKQRARTNAEPELGRPIFVVIGNPPYRGISQDGGKWIARLLQDYRRVDGARLGEKKVWLRNDYVRFIRLGQWCIERTGLGILGFITDHGYLDSPTFRGMRQQLLKTFDHIYVLNLHGNAKRREQAPNGGKDENVFDIKQGVAIALFVKNGGSRTMRRVLYEDLWGTRQEKLDRLAASSVATIRWRTLSPALPGFEFVPVNRKAYAEYRKYWTVKDMFAGSAHEIFAVGSNGVQTSRDHLVVGFSKAGLRERLQLFLASEKSDEQVRHEFFGHKSVGNYPPGDTRQWQLGKARNSLRQTASWQRAIQPYLYRPFDRRYLLHLDSMIDWPRPEVMSHLQQPNYALCVGRAGLVNEGTWDLVFCVNKLCDHNLFYRGSSVNFPLYLYGNGENGRVTNLSACFIERVEEIFGLPLVADKRGDLRRTIGPENVLHYAYAILHSPTYRRRYAEFLKVDFPRLPLTADRGLFRALCLCGEQLVRLHLLEQCPRTSAIYSVKGDDTVRQVRYREEENLQGRIWINATQSFEGVPREVWQFRIGGYQVCQKWLKDRKGRRLAHEDQACYGQIVGAIAQTIRLMHDIDTVIDQHGGWPIAQA